LEVEYGRSVIQQEAEALMAVSGRVDESFKHAVDLVMGCQGRVIVTGMGKAGIVGQKISATLASIGTPSFWLHPAEARHGDMGRVLKEDVVLVLSKSGETEEITALLPLLKRVEAKIIAIAGSRESTLGRYSEVVLEMGEVTEACPLGLAPSCSTSCMLAIGDALALTVLKRKDLGVKDFAQLHPGGSVPKLLKAADVMRTGDRFPVVDFRASVADAVRATTQARGGACSVVDDERKLVGVFTDGDFRRAYVNDSEPGAKPIISVMTREPRRIGAGQLATEAVRMHKEFHINQIPVVDDRNHPIGVIDIQDLPRFGLI